MVICKVPHFMTENICIQIIIQTFIHADHFIGFIVMAAFNLPLSIIIHIISAAANSQFFTVFTYEPFYIPGCI